jgi:hypothetical protein
MMFARSLLLDEIGGLFEQILQAQQRSDTLVERIFVSNHVAAGKMIRVKFSIF